MQKSIAVVAEYCEDRVRPITFELIRFARDLAEVAGEMVRVVVAGDEPEAPAREIAEREGLDVLAVRLSGAGALTCEGVLSALEEVLPGMNPSRVIFGHTSTGLHLAPALAAGLGASCVTGINGMVQGDPPLFSRSVCNGKFNAKMTADLPCILTLLPGAFGAHSDPLPCPAAGCVEVASFSAAPGNMVFRGVEEKAFEESPLGRARTVVAAGRGVGKEADLEKIHAFAALFPGAAVAGSRPLVDMGWMPYRQQVGITGATICPEIYIACGISGSSQHLAGMDKSVFVVAINKDPNATIFKHADLCIVDDLLSFIDAVVEEEVGGRL